METRNFQMLSELFEPESAYLLPHSHHPPELFSGECDEDFMDTMLCFPGSRFLKCGLNQVDLSGSEGFFMFVNAGGGKIQGLDCVEDGFYKGGDVIRTEERVIEGEKLQSIYQSARFGNFCYAFENLEPGDYCIDLHFAEIVNTNGPRGMRVFNVFVQGEKALSALDIYSCVGANRPLQVVDIRAAVARHGDTITIRFESIIGSPLVSGICIRRAPKLSDPLNNPNYVVCNKCSAQVEVSVNQIKDRNLASLAKLEKKNHELMNQYKLKTDECYEAWMMLSEANDKLEKLQIELEKKSFQYDSQDHELEMKEAGLREAVEKYEHGKKFWMASVRTLKEQIQVMRRDYDKLSEEAHGCATSIPDLNNMAHAVQALVRQCEDLKLKYSEEQAERKKLYNKVLEIKGNIRVFCRCRPLSKEEISSGSVMVADFEAAKDGELGINNGSATKKTFKFDRVYTPKDDQVDVFSDASALVVSVLDGYNVCIFAYGQTGTGKTFTMEGTQRNRGVNYRTLEELFRIAKERRETFNYEIFISVLEVYNEQIRDLLDPAPSSKKLEVRQEAEGVHHVPGVVEAKVNNVQEVWNVFQSGSNARAVGSNNVNEHSSRSHCMICITVRAKSLMNGECTKSKLWLVDLAGSERLAKTDARGERLNEAKNINRSLSALGDVISALATRSSHVPFRNSKLTHLLQDSLGGDSKTLMFVQISPSDKDLGETLSSLSFATRVRGVELGPAKKQIDVGEHQKQKSMLERAKQELKLKDESTRQLEESCQNLEAKLKVKDLQCKSYQEKIRELEGYSDSKTKELQSQLERQRLQFEELLRDKDGICRTLQQKVKELESKIKEQQLGSSTPIAAELLLKCEIDSHILRSSDSSNRSASRDKQAQTGSVLLRGVDSLQEVKRKRETKMGPVESENSIPMPTSLLDKKAIPSDINRLRQIDSSKAYGRLTRTSKGGTQKVVFVNKPQQGGWR